LKRLVAIIFIIVLSSQNYAQQWESKIVYYGADNKLVYERDSDGNMIPDFSYAGYRNGNDTIPYIPVIDTISPVEGDNTNHINNALFQAAYNPPDENGFRGAVLLNAGIYEVRGELYMKFPGIILRGVGDGEDPESNTIIYATGNSPSQRTILTAGGGTSSKWSHQVEGTQTNIISDTILIGENKFKLENISPFSVGDNIVIYHPCTDPWLETIDYGGTHSDDPNAEPEDIPWEVGSQPIVFNRYITAIEGNEITIYAPVYSHLIRELSKAYIYKYSRSGIVTNLGIENIRFDIETSGSPTDEVHTWNAVDLYQIEDSWVKDCTFLHFGLSGVRTNTATKITIENCKALEPVSIITGGRRYNFNAYTASQQILFKNCHASEGRHSYVSNGMSWTSGIVFYNCTSEGAYAASEGHRRWSQGLLYDNHRELDDARGGYNRRRIGLYNRAYYGTSHGWASVNSVAWNCDVRTGQILIQQAPTTQNYAIGCFASLVAGYGDSSFDEPTGYIEGTGQAGLNPQSLYMAQFNERMENIVSVENNLIEQLPEDYTLFQNYPNPFNPSTTIKFSLPKTSHVKVEIFDVTGRSVKTLFDGLREAGIINLQWNGDNNYYNSVGTGVYIYTIRSRFGILSGKMILLR